VKLFLTSSGIHESFKKDFVDLLPKKPISKISVAHIITAAFGEKGEKWWLNIAKEQLKKLGISDIEDLDIRGKTEDELYTILSQKDIILVDGGNTFFLLKYAKESGFDKAIKKLVNEGKIYIGISAGSYIACPTIEQSRWKHQDRNDFGLKDLTALNFVPFLLTAHFNEEIRNTLEEEIKSTNIPVICLYDGQSIIVKDNLVRVAGEGKKEFYNGFKEITG